jgi:hypothetical protein
VKNAGWGALAAACWVAAFGLAGCGNNRAASTAYDRGLASEYLREHGYSAAQIAFIDYSGFYDVNENFCGAVSDTKHEKIPTAATPAHPQYGDGAVAGGRVYAFHATEGDGLLCVRNDGSVDLLSPRAAVASAVPAAETAKR